MYSACPAKVHHDLWNQTREHIEKVRNKKYKDYKISQYAHLMYVFLSNDTVLLTFSDGIQISILKDDRQGAYITIQVCTFHWKWRQRQEVAGAFDGISHLLVTVSTDGGGGMKGDGDGWKKKKNQGFPHLGYSISNMFVLAKA